MPLGLLARVVRRSSLGTGEEERWLLRALAVVYEDTRFLKFCLYFIMSVPYILLFALVKSCEKETPKGTPVCVPCRANPSCSLSVHAF